VAERGPFAALVAQDGRFAELVRTQLAGGAAPVH
jgi:ABC-type multidrug transport system fused ATPase/permease subunit